MLQRLLVMVLGKEDPRAAPGPATAGDGERLPPRIALTADGIPASGAAIPSAVMVVKKAGKNASLPRG